MSCVVCPVFNRPDQTTDSRVCEACVQSVDDDLVALVRLVEALDDALHPARGAPANGARYSKPGPRLPLNLEALTLLGPGNRNGNDPLPPADLVREWATSWAVTRSLTGFPGEYALGADSVPVLEVTGVRLIVGWLRDRLLWASETVSEFPRFAKELHASVKQVQRVTGEAVGLDRRPIGWCPTEGNGGQCLAPLSASAWDNEIECSGCGTRFSRADWPQLQQVLREQGLVRR